MIGAIIGDLVGSRFEWNNHRSKNFHFLTHKSFFTDDSVMSLAVCDALLHCKPDYSDLSHVAVRFMQRIGRPYPNCGYGGSFHHWMYSENPQPYNSYGNGAAMRVSGCGYVANSIAEAIALSRAVTEITHGNRLHFWLNKCLKDLHYYDICRRRYSYFAECVYMNHISIFSAYILNSSIQINNGTSQFWIIRLSFILMSIIFHNTILWRLRRML